MEDSTRTIAKGAVIVFIGLIISKIFTYLYRILLARGLGPEAYGIFSLCFAIVSFLTAMSKFGVPSALERYIPIYLKDKSRLKGIITFSLRTAFIVSLILAVLTFVFSSNIAVWLNSPEISEVLKIFSLSIPFIVLLSLLVSISKGFKNILYPTISFNLIYPSFNLLLAGMLIYMGYGVVSIAIAFFAANVLALLFLVLKIETKIFSFTAKIKPVFMNSEILKYSVPLLFVAISYLIIGWTDTIMLGYFESETVVGLYNAALPTAALMMFAPSVLVPLLLPVFSSLMSKKKNNQISNLYKTVSYWTVLINLPLLMLFFAASNLILKILFGDIFTTASFAFIVLSAGFFMKSLAVPSIKMMELHKQTKTIFWIILSSALLNVLLNLAMIPRYGMDGAAISSAISFLIIFLAVSFIVFIKHKIYFVSKRMLKAIITTVVVFAPFLYVYETLLPRTLITVIVLAAVSGSIYFVLSYLFVFSSDDKALIKKLFSKITRLNI
ncbi:MAG TPA: flippase [Bacteroidetes bacterium]|nr:flippase [Bacteroidota bacterium]